MAIKLEVPTLDGVDETLAALYKEADGKFVLDVEGLPDTTGLKTALDKERKTVRELKSSLNEFKTFDQDKYHDLLSREAELLKHDPAQIDQMLRQRVEQNNQSWQEKFNDLNGKLTEKDQRLADLLISDELRKVGSELGVLEGEAMVDFVSRGKGVFKLKEGVVTPLKGDDVLYGESGVEPLTMREFGKKLSETATHLFKSSSGGGASTTGDGKARSGTVRCKADLKTPAEKAAFIGKNGRTAYLELPSELKTG
jgi:hypothetical protein